MDGNKSIPSVSLSLKPCLSNYGLRLLYNFFKGLCFLCYFVYFFFQQEGDEYMPYFLKTKQGCLNHDQFCFPEIDNKINTV